MSSDSRRRLNAQVYEEAGEWFVRFRTERVDEASRREFDRCLRGSPEFLRAYLELTGIWNEAERLDVERHWDTESLIAAAAGDPDVVELKVPAAPAESAGSVDSTHLPAAPPHAPGAAGRRLVARARRHWPLWSLGAGIAAGIVAGVAVMLVRTGWQTYTTGTGEQRVLTLADGSTADLNTQSKIQVRYSPHERSVRLLKGEALFHVAHDRTRPFVVGSDSARVRAVGTEFDVYEHRSATIVSVLEGRVEVEVKPQASARTTGARAPQAPRGAIASAVAAPAVSARRAELPAGYRLVVDGTHISKSTRVDPTAAIAWTQQQLIFDSSPVADIAEEFNRYNARQLIVQGSLSQVRLSGVFSTTNPMAFVRFLQDRFGARVSETSSSIIVSN